MCVTVTQHFEAILINIHINAVKMETTKYFPSDSLEHITVNICLIETMELYFLIYEIIQSYKTEIIIYFVVSDIITFLEKMKKIMKFHIKIYFLY